MKIYIFKLKLQSFQTYFKGGLDSTISLDDFKNLYQNFKKLLFSVIDYCELLWFFYMMLMNYDSKLHLIYNRCLNGTFP